MKILKMDFMVDFGTYIYIPLQKIESHEKLCRIMQKQTFDQIKEMQERIKRLEYWIVGGMGAVLITLLTDVAK